MYVSRDTALNLMLTHYNSEIEKVCNKVEFKRSVGIAPTEESVSKTNEELYQLFMFRKNILDVKNRDAEDFDF